VRAAVPRLFTLLSVSFVLVACNSTFTIVSNGFFLGFSTSTILTTQDGTPVALVVTVHGAPDGCWLRSHGGHHGREANSPEIARRR
jgi:hypothetical protein